MFMFFVDLLRMLNVHPHPKLRMYLIITVIFIWTSRMKKITVISLLLWCMLSKTIMELLTFLWKYTFGDTITIWHCSYVHFKLSIEQMVPSFFDEWCHPSNVAGPKSLLTPEICECKNKCVVFIFKLVIRSHAFLWNWYMRHHGNSLRTMSH